MVQEHQKKQVQHSLLGAVVMHAAFVMAKLGIGFTTGAVSMIADGLHSAINLLSTATTYTTVRQKNTFADTLRQYGEAQADHILSVMEALLILVVSGIIGSESWHRIAAPQIMPGLLHWGMAVMAFSTLTHAVISQVFSSRAKQTGSAELAAASGQARLDVWLSALVATAFAVMEITGWYWLDAVMACVITVHLLYVGWQMLRTHYNGYNTFPVSALEENRIGRIILDNPGVLGYHNLRIRTEHQVMKLCFHLEVSKELPSYQAHAVSDAVSMSLLLQYGPCAPQIHIDRK